MRLCLQTLVEEITATIGFCINQPGKTSVKVNNIIFLYSWSHTCCFLCRKLQLEGGPKQGGTLKEKTWEPRNRVLDWKRQAKGTHQEGNERSLEESGSMDLSIALPYWSRTTEVTKRDVPPKQKQWCLSRGIVLSSWRVSRKISWTDMANSTNKK